MSTRTTGSRSRRVAVAGATGLTGHHVAGLLRAAGHEVVPLSRAAGIDLTTGVGLEAALVGVDAVVDVTNVTATRAGPSVAFFSAVTSALLAAGARAGVRHHVALSIVGCDRVPLGYYAGKVRQERLVLADGVPGSVLRATQFHEFADQVLGRVPGPLALVPRMRIQPVAVSEVADALVALVLGEPRGLAPELAGPREEELVDLARRLSRARGWRRPVIGVRMPGGAGRGLIGGDLLPATAGPRGRLTFDAWLVGAAIAGPPPAAPGPRGPTPTAERGAGTGAR